MDRRRFLKYAGATLTIVSVLLSLVPLSSQVRGADLGSFGQANLTQDTASLYTTILRKNVQTVIDELRKTSTIIVFRGYYKYGFTEDESAAYPLLKNAIHEIKKELPYVHLMGAISAAGFMKGDTWPNGTAIPSDMWKDITLVLPNGSLARYASDPTLGLVFDIRKQMARDFLVAWAELQIDAGFDLMFFDEIDYITRVYGISASAFYTSWKDISDRLKAYASSKYDVNLLLGVNGGWVNDPNEETLVSPWPYQDFISVSFSLRTMQTGVVQDDWSAYKRQTLAVYNSLPPIFTFLDWGSIPSPMSALAAHSPQEQGKLLEKLQASALQNGLIFVYPLHGGNIASSGAEYDAVQQGTIGTIASLASQIVQIITVTQTTSTILATTETVTTTVTNVSSELTGQPELILVVGVIAAFAGGATLGLIWKRKRLH